MNNRGFVLAYTGMLYTATRRDASGSAERPRRRVRSLAARLFGFA